MTVASGLYLKKTPLGGTGCLDSPYLLLTGCRGIQFFDSPPLVAYTSLCSACVTYGMLCHTTGHQVLPTQPLSREVEDFPRNERHVPPLTYLIYLLPND